jgi:sterol 24-C-methyltransferase
LALPRKRETGLKCLATLSPEDKQVGIDAYRFFQTMQAGEPTETADETKALAD